MKIKIWMLSALLGITTLAHAATNDLTGLLQQGLFEEEANRNLDAAIANYQTLASAFDKDRQLAATAIFRLGECYRKLGKTNDAVIQYQRIVKEFSDQQTLVTLSQQNLAGLGARTAGATASSDFSSPLSEQQQQLSQQLQQLRQRIEEATAQLTKEQAMSDTLREMPQDKLRESLPQLVPDAQLESLEMRLSQAQQDLIKLRSDYTPDHPKYKTSQEIVADLGKKITDRINAIMEGMTARENSEQNYIDQLRLQQARHKELSQVSDAGSSGNSDSAPTTDEEQTQIRNIQAMIQNSPDLINAPHDDFNGETSLQTAATKGQLVVAKYLLDHGADVDKTAVGGDDRGKSPLYLAARQGHKAMVELLLSRGASVNSGFSALNIAISKGFTGVVEVLLANKADVNSWGDNNGRVLHTAVLHADTNLIQLLIAHGADVNTTNFNGNTPLHLATDENTARLLIAAKANVEARNQEGNTPLHEAASRNNSQTVSLLLRSGAVVDATNNHDATPLLLAPQAGGLESARLLLAAKADPNHVGRVRWSTDYTAPVPPIYLALWQNNKAMLKLLLDSGANPEGNPAPFSSPLHEAMRQQNIGSAQLLLEHGANPNRPSDNTVPLREALGIEKIKPLVSLLLEKGANPNAPDSDGFTPLFHTTDLDLVRELIAHKADLNARDKNGATRIIRESGSVATPLEKAAFVKTLIDAGAKTDLQDNYGNTALHFAIDRLDPETVAVLLANHANPNVQNDEGFTPLDLAKAGSVQRRDFMLGFSPLQNLQLARNREISDAPSGGTTPPSEAEKKIVDLLVNAGGLANLPKRDRIEVRRASNRVAVLDKDSHDWNHFSLLEVVACTYGMLSQNSDGGNLPAAGNMRRTVGFPDFKKVLIYRRTDKSAKQTAINIDLDSILTNGDCSRDQTLEWGDVIEIPEADHPVNEQWNGLADPVEASLNKCLSRQVTVQINGTSSTLKLAPHNRINFGTASFMLRHVLDYSNLIRVSSDLSRVKVTRQDPITGKKLEWTVDCTGTNTGDFWLREGDVIDVPEK